MATRLTIYKRRRVTFKGVRPQYWLNVRTEEENGNGSELSIQISRANYGALLNEHDVESKLPSIIEDTWEYFI